MAQQQALDANDTDHGPKVIRRNGQVTGFDDSKIAVALTKAFLAVEGEAAGGSGRVHETVATLTAQVVQVLRRRAATSGVVHIEDIQDQVELALMRSGEHKIARAYLLYRESQAQKRAQDDRPPSRPDVRVLLDTGERAELDEARLRRLVREACEGLTGTDPDDIVASAVRDLYDGISEKDVSQAVMLSARSRIEREPNHTYASARLLLDALRHEALVFLGQPETRPTHDDMKRVYPVYFRAFIQRGIEVDLLDPRLADFDLERLGQALLPERDFQFDFLGLQTLYDRYFLHHKKTRFELPQAFFLRVAMGLSIEEPGDREARAIEFYRLLSSFDFMSSTPTLFNAGTLRPQLSSCYLTSVPDDLDGIFGAIHDNAMLSKFAGGLGNDWTPVRGIGAYIKGTNGQSQGVVPFLKVANDTALAVNQCFAPDTLLHTADGVMPIRDVVPGTLVLGTSGTYREVTERFLYNQTGPMLRLKVKHSVAEIHVTDGHPFYAIQGVPQEQAIARTRAWLAKDKIRHAWVDARELKAGDYLAQVIPTETVPVAGFTEADARLYGILLGDGHLAKDGMQWGVSGHPGRDEHMAFVRGYLAEHGIHFWETAREGGTYAQVHWASGRGVRRDGTTGRIVGAGVPTLPFTHEDLYDANGQKRIARRFAHLPRPQAVALVHGLLETDGCVSRGAEITFTNTSEALAEGVRYQMLRLGVPTSGQKRTRHAPHTGTRADGTTITFDKSSTAWDIRIPAAVPELAARLGCRTVTKRNWLTADGMIFSRLTRVEPAETHPFVYDLIVEGDESYMTTSALAHNGGKRKGAVCAYLETWHRDIEEFLELRKNTGDDRRRTHDMNTANWVPDLFMKRVAEEGPWTLFSPNDVPDLHDLTGTAFEERYVHYEGLATEGKIKNSKRLPAINLWRKMLGMLFETGHPWVTFKDACNIRSPQGHVGMVHSSNLCTEITLNTKPGEEIAVCNLGSVNLPRHLDADGRFDVEKLERTVTTAMRMLDNVIDINYYSVDTARASNARHRPVGLGVMGFNDALYKLRLAYESDAAIKFADESMEAVSYFAIKASTVLASERGKYSSFEGSLWSQGILPQDSVHALIAARGEKYLQHDFSESGRFDWNALRETVKTTGMRNSNCMAIAPTATIANITGVSQSIEPTYQNLYVKSNLSGDFTVVNEYLVNDLKRLGLWDEVMAHDMKYYDGSVQAISRVPDDLKAVYKTAFEIDARRLIDAAARRQKWIDQAQSLNLYMAQPSGKKLDELYRYAWTSGLKTTYYLRTMGATHVEKTTITDTRLNKVQSGSDAPAMPPQSPVASLAPKPAPAPTHTQSAAAAPTPSPITAPASAALSRPKSLLHAAPAPATAAAASAPDLFSTDSDATLSVSQDSGSGKVCSILDPDCEACQ